MLAVGDPVGIGAVRSIARPGTNVTGVSFISSDLAPKRLQLVKELLPRARSVAVVWDAQNANAAEEVRATQAAAAAFGLAARSFPVAREADLDDVLARVAAARPDVLYAAFEGRLVAGNRHQFAQFALARRIALVAGWSRVAEAGGLLSYAPDIPLMFGRAATFVHRILAGERPETMPIEQPTRIELVLNARTAKALGISLPQSLLLRADRVIE
jgi:putative ABC transport system substrate-binding protein